MPGNHKKGAIILITITGLMILNGLSTVMANGSTGECPPKTSNPNTCDICYCWHEC